MVKVEYGDGLSFQMDGYLHNNLSYAKNKIKEDWDFLFCCDGKEGSGKSLFTQQVAYFCDPTINLDRIVFTPKQFRQAILNAKPYQAVIYDEAYGGINSRATMSKVNRSIVKMLTEIRSRNLFVFIVLPCFFDLDRYVALFRARGLFHIYVNDNWERGFFTAYNEDKKKDLYILGKKFMNYNVVQANFHGRFYDKWMVDKEAYEKKKREAQLEDNDEILVFDDEFRKKIILFTYGNPKLKNADEKAKALNMTTRRYYQLLTEYKALLSNTFEEFKIEIDPQKDDNNLINENIK